MEETAMKEIVFGMIGAGSVTEKKSAPALSKVPGSRLKRVMRRDAAKLTDYAKRHGIAQFSTDYMDIMNDPEINAVYIATPPDSHAFYTLEAAKHGKAVYVEKPMARTVAEAKAMVEACHQAGVPLFVAYYRCAQPRFLTAKTLMDQGALGEIRSFTYRYACPPPKGDPNRPWLLTKELAGGGLTYDVGSHMLDIIIFLLGQPVEVIGRSNNQTGLRDTNDMASALMVFENGVQGSVQLSFNAATSHDELWLSGSKGSLSLSIMRYEPLKFEHEGLTEVIDLPMPEHVQLPLITRVVRTLQGLDDLDASGLSPLQTQEILEAVDSGRAWTFQGPA